MTMKELNNILSEQAKDDLVCVAQWINPLPDQASTLLEKITIALNIVQYSHNRQGETPVKIANNPHLAALIRLKDEVSQLVAK